MPVVNIQVVASLYLVLVYYKGLERSRNPQILEGYEEKDFDVQGGNLIIPDLAFARAL